MKLNKAQILNALTVNCHILNVSHVTMYTILPVGIQMLYTSLWLELIATARMLTSQQSELQHKPEPPCFIFLSFYMMHDVLCRYSAK